MGEGIADRRLAKLGREATPIIMLTKIIKFIKSYQSDIILVVAVVLISITSFNLGKISAFHNKKPPVTITEQRDTGAQIIQDKDRKESSAAIKDFANEPVVVSKKSSGKLYHFSWCPGASKISEKNKLTFANETAAISAGYTLASNCVK